MESSVYHLGLHRARASFGWLLELCVVLSAGLSLSRAVLRCRELQLRSNFKLSGQQPAHLGGLDLLVSSASSTPSPRVAARHVAH